jgi:hypothetical protein
MVGVSALRDIHPFRGVVGCRDGERLGSPDAQAEKAPTGGRPLEYHGPAVNSSARNRLVPENEIKPSELSDGVPGSFTVVVGWVVARFVGKLLQRFPRQDRI